MPNPHYGRLMVLLQFVLLCVFFLQGRWIARLPLLCAAEICGVALGVWAVLLMRRRLRATPEPAPDGALITHGPYRWIRHPMYSGLLLATLALLLDDPSRWRAASWGLLALVLAIKLNYEERLLADRFPAYRAYRDRTKRLLPFVY